MAKIFDERYQLQPQFANAPNYQIPAGGYQLQEPMTAQAAAYQGSTTPGGGETSSSDGDFDTEDTKFKMMTSYATTVVDPRAYYASEGV